MQYTRKQIINHLRTHHTSTAPELSQVLNLTVGNIRHHIKELETQNMIEKLESIPAKGRGRPTYFYRLTNRILDHNLVVLSQNLLTILLQDLSNIERQETLHKLSTRIIGNIPLEAKLTQRMTQAIRWLNQNNYKSRWEASPTGPRVFLGHCPYRDIVDSNPEICQLDTTLLQLLTGLSLEHIEKMSRRLPGSQYCIFSTR